METSVVLCLIVMLSFEFTLAVDYSKKDSSQPKKLDYPYLAKYHMKWLGGGGTWPNKDTGINDTYCMYNMGTGYQTKSVPSQNNKTLQYMGEATSGSADWCGYGFTGQNEGFGETWQKCVRVETFSVTNCALTVKYYAFYTASSTPAMEVTNCTRPADFCTNKTYLLVGVESGQQNSGDILFKIGALNWADVSGAISGLQSTILPVLLAGIFAILILMF